MPVHEWLRARHEEAIGLKTPQARKDFVLSAGNAGEQARRLAAIAYAQSLPRPLSRPKIGPLVDLAMSHLERHGQKPSSEMHEALQVLSACLNVIAKRKKSGGLIESGKETFLAELQGMLPRPPAGHWFELRKQAGHLDGEWPEVSAELSRLDDPAEKTVALTSFASAENVRDPARIDFAFNLFEEVERHVQNYRDKPTLRNHFLSLGKTLLQLTNRFSSNERMRKRFLEVLGKFPNQRELLK